MSRLFIHRKSRVGSAIAVSLLGLATTGWTAGYPERFALGSPATPEEVASVAIAVSPDGRGLPPGSGDWASGRQVYETHCASCHGADFMGRTGFADMPQGAALRLLGGRGTLNTLKPIFTVESFWPYATTLFDYTRRAMPFTAPGSLTNDEVYAVTAYILAEGKIIDRSAIMNADTLPRVRMPNRDGFIPDPRPEIFRD